MDNKLTDDEIRNGLDTLSDWAVVDGSLHRPFRFPDFISAFSFMTRVALVAERMGHHPDWSNSYDTVTIDLSTHSAGGITAKDFDLAREIDTLLL